jgi:hypothetical protein
MHYAEKKKKRSRPHAAASWFFALASRRDAKLHPEHTNPIRLAG